MSEYIKKQTAVNLLKGWEQFYQWNQLRKKATDETIISPSAVIDGIPGKEVDDE